MIFRHSAQPSGGVMEMQDMHRAENERDDAMPFLRLEPEKRLCPAYDPVTIAKYRVGSREDMGFRVLDNFCEEHIM